MDKQLNRFISFELLFCLLFIIAFFLPWVDMGIIKIVGWDIPSLQKKMTQVSNFFSVKKSFVYQAYAVYLIPLMSVVIAVLWMKMKQRLARLLLSITGLYTLAISIYLFFAVPKAGSGVYMLTVSSLLCLTYLYFAFFKKKEEMEEDI